MTSLVELAASLPSCAATCFGPENPAAGCIASNDVPCFCEISKTADQSCLAQSCKLQDVMTVANATNTACGREPSVDHSFVPIFIAFLAVAGLFVVLRWVARIIMGMKLWWDDLFNFVAYLCCITYTVYGIMLRHGGLGTEVWAVPFSNLRSQFIGYYVMALSFFIARFMVRLSILCFYMRIFRATRADKLIRGTLVVTVVVFIPLYLAATFQCRPVQFFWHRVEEGAKGKCVDDKAFLWASWIILLLNDFWILILPIPLIARLQLSLRKRLLVLVMFGMGIGVIITSIYKLTLIEQYTDTSSPTTNVVAMSIWAGMDINLGVIFACLPSLPALFQPLIRRFGSTGSRSSQGNVGYGVSGHASRYDMLDKPSISIPPSVASRDVDKQIRMTTTIHQNIGLSESEEALRDDEEIELSDARKGITRATAWA